MSLRHKSCGGTIINRKCSKCEKVWSKIKYVFAQDIETFDDSKFDPKKYRERIRSGKDLP